MGDNWPTKSNRKENADWRILSSRRPSLGKKNMIFTQRRLPVAIDLPACHISVRLPLGFRLPSFSKPLLSKILEPYYCNEKTGDFVCLDTIDGFLLLFVGVLECWGCGETPFREMDGRIRIGTERTNPQSINRKSYRQLPVPLPSMSRTGRTVFLIMTGNMDFSSESMLYNKNRRVHCNPR